MSDDARAERRARQQGLRIAAAVAVGFTASVASGEVLPFLAPLFASQFLVASHRPLSLGQAIGLLGVILAVGGGLVWLTGLLNDRPAALLALLGLGYFFCFLLLSQGKAVVFPILIIAVIVPILGVLQRNLGEGIVLILFKSALGGMLLSWLCHAVFPDPGGALPPPPAPPTLDQSVHRALANAVILLILVTVCLTNSRFSTAIVVPITAASLLNQFDLATSGRTALGLMIVNLLGGVFASFAFGLVQLWPNIVFLFLVTLAVALLFGGRAAVAPKAAKVYAGALTTFLILFGTGVSPLPATTPESFTTRIGLVLFAIACTFCLAALLWPRTEGAAAGERAA